MPQMAPMSWTLLFIMFSMNMMIMGTMNYYLYTPVPKTHMKHCANSKMMNWKW